MAYAQGMSEKAMMMNDKGIILEQMQIFLLPVFFIS